MLLAETRPTDWQYLSEGGATIVFSYRGPADPNFDGTVLRVGKRVGGSAWTEFEGEGVESRLLFHEHCIERLVSLEYLVRPQQLDAPSKDWLEDLARCAGASRERKDPIDTRTPRLALVKDLVGGEGVVAVEIKPKWGFLPCPTYLSEETRPIKTRTCRFCMHAHLQAAEGEIVPVGYCPLDLYSGDAGRVRTALEAMWDAWMSSGDLMINLRVFVQGAKVRPHELESIRAALNRKDYDVKDALISSLLPILLNSPVLPTLGQLQRQLDALDIEGLTSIYDLSSSQTQCQPTIADWDAWLAQYQAEPLPTPVSENAHYYALAYVLSATFKDCSIIVRIPDGTATIIDTDVKSIRRFEKWAKLDRRIVSEYAKLPEEERRHCVDAYATDGCADSKSKLRL